MIVPIPYVHIGIGLCTVLISIPLIIKKVPMNRVYGIRVQKAFVSDGNWYKLNSYGGKLFLVFGLFLFGFGCLGGYFAPPPTSLWAPVYLVVPLTAIVPVVVLINAFARGLPDR
jgi:hypothetical protein